MDDILTWLKTIGLPAGVAALIFPIMWVADKFFGHRHAGHAQEINREELLLAAERDFRTLLAQQIDSLRTEVHKMRNQLQLAYKHLDDCYAANGELRQLNAELRVEVVSLKAIVVDLRAKVDAMGSPTTPPILLPPEV